MERKSSKIRRTQRTHGAAMLKALDAYSESLRTRSQDDFDAFNITKLHECPRKTNWHNNKAARANNHYSEPDIAFELSEFALYSIVLRNRNFRICAEFVDYNREWSMMNELNTFRVVESTNNGDLYVGWRVCNPPTFICAVCSVL